MNTKENHVYANPGSVARAMCTPHAVLRVPEGATPSEGTHQEDVQDHGVGCVEDPKKPPRTEI
jgi:hypothetical protein